MSDQPSTSHDDLNTSTIALVGLIGSILVFAVIVLLVVVFFRVEAGQAYRKDVGERYVEVSDLVARQRGRLASYGWVDQKREIAHIPIGRAMDLVLAELKQDPAADVTGVREETPPAETPKGETDAR